MIVNYIKAMSDSYLLKIPSEFINSELKITIKKVKNKKNHTLAEELINDTAGILNKTELDISEYQSAMREEWER